VKRTYIGWGLAGAAFLVTLGITSWRNGLWSSDEPSAQSGDAAASHSIQMPAPMPKHPFQAAVIPPAASPPPHTTLPAQTTPPPAQANQSPPEPTAGNAPNSMQNTPTAPDPLHEQSQDDYKQRAKLMTEIAERAR
jgi:hypothetical protein